MTELDTLKNQLQAENTYLRDEIEETGGFGEIVTQSPAFTSILRKVEQVAPTPTTVLIPGESGTGKELLARAIHQRRPRKNQPMIKVNCAALPPIFLKVNCLATRKGRLPGL